MSIYHLLHQLGCRYIHILYITLSITLYIPYFIIFHCISYNVFSTLKFHNWHLLVQAWIHDQFLSLQRKLSKHMCASCISNRDPNKYDNFLKSWRDQYEKLWKTWKDLERPNTFQDLSPTASPALLAEPSLFTSETCRREDLKFQGHQERKKSNKCNKRAHSMPSSALLSDPTTTIHETQPGQPKHILRLNCLDV